MLLVYLNIRLIVRWIFSDYHLSYSYSTGHHGKGFFNSFSISPSWSFFWSLFSRIRNKYVGSLSKSPNSLGIRENDDLKKVLWCFQGVSKETSGMRWVKSNCSIDCLDTTASTSDHTIKTEYIQDDQATLNKQLRRVSRKG